MASNKISFFLISMTFLGCGNYHFHSPKQSHATHNLKDTSTNPTIQYREGLEIFDGQNSWLPPYSSPTQLFFAWGQKSFVGYS